MRYEKRSVFRQTVHAPMIFTQDLGKKYYEATVYNSCAEGMYFESSSLLRPKSLIYIKVPQGEKVCVAGACKAYMGNVRWCKKLSFADDLRYGIGVQYILKGYIFEDARAAKASYWCDLCGERSMNEIHTTEEHIYLCKNCFRRLGEMGVGRIRDSVLRFSAGNVC